MNIRSYPNDYLILGAILLLSGFGIVMMYSASSIYAMNEFDDYMLTVKVNRLAKEELVKRGETTEITMESLFEELDQLEKEGIF